MYKFINQSPYNQNLRCNPDQKIKCKIKLPLQKSVEYRNGDINSNKIHSGKVSNFNNKNPTNISKSSKNTSNNIQNKIINNNKDIPNYNKVSSHIDSNLNNLDLNMCNTLISKRNNNYNNNSLEYITSNSVNGTNNINESLSSLNHLNSNNNNNNQMVNYKLNSTNSEKFIISIDKRILTENSITYNEVVHNIRQYLKRKKQRNLINYNYGNNSINNQNHALENKTLNSCKILNKKAIVNNINKNYEINNINNLDIKTDTDNVSTLSYDRKFSSNEFNNKIVCEEKTIKTKSGTNLKDNLNQSFVHSHQQSFQNTIIANSVLKANFKQTKNNNEIENFQSMNPGVNNIIINSNDNYNNINLNIIKKEKNSEAEKTILIRSNIILIILNKALSKPKPVSLQELEGNMKEAYKKIKEVFLCKLKINI